MMRPRNGRNVARAIEGARHDVVNGMATTLTENFAETVFQQRSASDDLLEYRFGARTTCDPAHSSSGRQAGRA